MSRLQSIIKKKQNAEETLLLATANNLGVTVDELKEQYKSIKVNPDKISELIFEPFERISESLVTFEVGFGKNLSGASGAIKELTGGLIDLGQFAEDGADKVKMVGTLIATPFKLANITLQNQLNSSLIKKSTSVKNYRTGGVELRKRLMVRLSKQMVSKIDF